MNEIERYRVRERDGEKKTHNMNTNVHEMRRGLQYVNIR